MTHHVYCTSSNDCNEISKIEEKNYFREKRKRERKREREKMYRGNHF